MLFTVDGYVYGGKRFDVRETVASLRADLPSLRATVLVPYLDPDQKHDHAHDPQAPQPESQNAHP